MRLCGISSFWFGLYVWVVMTGFALGSAGLNIGCQRKDTILPGLSELKSGPAALQLHLPEHQEKLFHFVFWPFHLALTRSLLVRRQHAPTGVFLHRSACDPWGCWGVQLFFFFSRPHPRPKLIVKVVFKEYKYVIWVIKSPNASF